MRQRVTVGGIIPAGSKVVRFGYDNAPYVEIELPERRVGMRPDFDAVRDKRMNELTPEQQRDAHELWIRENVGWFLHDAVKFLLERLDEARAQQPEAPAVPVDPAGHEMTPPCWWGRA